VAFLDSILGGSKVTSIGETGKDPINLDASVREVHSVSGEVSEHPVEKGTDIVDNYRVLPRQLQIDGVVTNSPLSTAFPGSSLINSAIAVLSGDREPIKIAWQEFERFFDEAVVLTITTSLRDYPNMVLTGLEVTRDAGNATKLTFTASAREIIFVDTQEGDALAIPVSTLGQAAKSAGKSTNSAANAAEADEASLGLKIFQGLRVVQ
jgi:hypothetical protein